MQNLNDLQGKDRGRLNVTINNLDEAIKAELENYNVEVVKATNESIREAAKEATKILKNGGPYQARTGAYEKTGRQSKGNGQVRLWKWTDIQFSTKNITN